LSQTTGLLAYYVSVYVMIYFK